MWASVAAAIAAAWQWLADLGRRRERADAERTGAIKQREADKADELRDTREQLDEAVNHRPDDWRGADRF